MPDTCIVRKGKPSNHSCLIHACSSWCLHVTPIAVSMKQLRVLCQASQMGCQFKYFKMYKTPTILDKIKGTSFYSIQDCSILFRVSPAIYLSFKPHTFKIVVTCSKLQNIDPKSRAQTKGGGGLHPYHVLAWLDSFRAADDIPVDNDCMNLA